MPNDIQSCRPVCGRRYFRVGDRLRADAGLAWHRPIAMGGTEEKTTTNDNKTHTHSHSHSHSHILSKKNVGCIGCGGLDITNDYYSCSSLIEPPRHTTPTNRYWWRRSMNLHQRERGGELLSPFVLFTAKWQTVCSRRANVKQNETQMLT